MIRMFQSFEELADAMTKGGGKLHTFNCAAEDEFYDDPCYAWQKGVRDFAAWLDHIGLKVEIPDKAEDFYDFMHENTKKS